ADGVLDARPTRATITPPPSALRPPRRPHPSPRRTMIRTRFALLLPAFGLAILLAGCNVRVTTGDKKGGDAPDTPTGRDPAEQETIKLVKQHNGYATQDDKQPGKPVVAIGVFGDKITDADLKTLAACKKLRKLDITSTKITGAGLKQFADCPNLTELE